MTLRQQVCTLEQAIRLKELGCEYPCFFSYSMGEFGPNNLYFKDPPTSTSKMASGTYPAYTVAELGEMLVQAGQYNMPMLVNLPTTIANPEVRTNELAYCHELLQLPRPDEIYGGLDMYFIYEAEARAALLIHELEKKINQGA